MRSFAVRSPRFPSVRAGAASCAFGGGAVSGGGVCFFSSVCSVFVAIVLLEPASLNFAEMLLRRPALRSGGRASVNRSVLGARTVSLPRCFSCAGAVISAASRLNVCDLGALFRREFERALSGQARGGRLSKLLGHLSGLFGLGPLRGRQFRRNRPGLRRRGDAAEHVAAQARFEGAALAFVERGQPALPVLEILHFAGVTAGEGVVLQP